MPLWKNGDPLPSGWSVLDKATQKDVWRRFGHSFDFRASTDRINWPGIKERTPSLTYKLPPFATIDEQALWDVFLAAFRQLALRPGHETLYVLDWQHECYEMTPAEATETWVVPLVPNGDYYIFLDKQFRYGTFGHPWEWSLHVFGAPLLKALKEPPRPELKTILRKCGGVS